MIIDIHTHLGDVLYPAGGSIIENGHTRMPLVDPLKLFERRGWRGIRGQRFLETWTMRTGMARSRAATRANLRAEMDKYGVDYAAMMAVPPAVTFEQLHAAYLEDQTLLPFTGIDYAKLENVDSQFSADYINNAHGLKLHPILQQVRLCDPRTCAVVEAFAPYDLPVLFHAGVCEYYIDPAEKQNESPEFGAVEDALPLIHNFPNVNFIIGHSGLDGFRAVIELFSHLPNVYIDVSFQSAVHVRKLLAAFGTERVLFGSDWPWGRMDVSLKILEEVCDSVQLRRVLGENSAELLQINDHSSQIKLNINSTHETTNQKHTRKNSRHADAVPR